jgi:hypothetical protein
VALGVFLRVPNPKVKHAIEVDDTPTWRFALALCFGI